MEGQSEVAGLVAQIKSEYQAAKLGLSGLAQGTSQHSFITRRMERIAELHAELRGLVDDETMRVINEQLDQDENDPELVAIATELQETAAYAIDPAKLREAFTQQVDAIPVDPAFKEELREKLMHQMTELQEGGDAVESL
jgi:hypothetical protein